MLFLWLCWVSLWLSWLLYRRNYLLHYSTVIEHCCLAFARVAIFLIDMGSCHRLVSSVWLWCGRWNAFHDAYGFLNLTMCLCTQTVYVTLVEQWCLEFLVHIYGGGLLRSCVTVAICCVDVWGGWPWVMFLWHNAFCVGNNG